MEKYAKVIVRSNTFHTDNLFTYKIPEFLKNQIYVGHRVLVPFGKGNKPTEAFVFKISDTLEEDMKLKEVVDVLDEEPIFKLEDLELVNWMKNRYLCTYIDCINLIVIVIIKVEVFSLKILITTRKGGRAWSLRIK